MNRTILLAMLLAAAGQAFAADQPTLRVTRQTVNEKVDGLVKLLWSRQTSSGLWERGEPPKPPTDGRWNGTNFFGGHTAIALLALKVAGVNERDERFTRGLAALDRVESGSIYIRGIQTMLYSRIKDDAYRDRLLRQGKFVMDGIAAKTGMYGYAPARTPNDRGDMSNTQYGLLGVWAASDGGMEVPAKYWQLLEKTYITNQCDDGGYNYLPYVNKKGSYGSMTAAAVANMFVIWEKLYILPDRTCRARSNPDLIKAIDRGLDWLDKNFRADDNPFGWGQHRNYYYYTLERVGVASGIKYFGKHDWYREAAFAIINDKPRGLPTPEAAFQLMFLCFGRAPVAFNKLRLGDDWNNRPREYAMLCRRLNDLYEVHHNWQIMPVEAPLEGFHDAPLLSISGKKPLPKLKPEELEKLRTYLLRGGTLYAEAIDNSAAFVASLRGLCQQLFPQYELGPLAGEHPLYSTHFKLPGQPPLLGMSDGVRTMIVVSPREMACDWQRLGDEKATPSFQFAVNLLTYATDKQLWSKEESYWPTDEGVKPDRTIRVGRLIHTAKDATHIWDPTSSQGWIRMDIISRNSGGPAIAIEPVDPAKPIDVKAVPIVHVTGIGEMMLADAAKKNLADYVAAGGIVLADVTGGISRPDKRSAFADSFSRLAEQLVPGQKLTPLADKAFLADALTEGRTWYRHVNDMPRNLRPLELLAVNVKQPDGTLVPRVLFLPNDMTYAMLGNPTRAISGLEPQSAQRLALAILNWATRPRSEP